MRKAEALANEYRNTMPAEVMKLWGADAAAELRLLAAENEALKAAVKQARIDALEEAKQACNDEADQFRECQKGASDGRYDWKEDGARDCAAAIESLKGTP